MSLDQATPPVFELASLSARGVDEKLLLEIKRQLVRLYTKDSDITGGVVDRYIRKAIRNGAWRALSYKSRALLLALRSWRSNIRSRVLREILAWIFLEIDLYTIRGKAILYGYIVALNKARDILSDILANISKLIILGIMYLNLPLLHRVYG